jgi:hypothetical protein
MTRQYRRYTDKQLVEAVKTSYSISQVLKKIGLKEAGGSRQAIKLKIEKMHIECSHFTGQHHAKGSTHNRNKKIPLEKILVKNSKYARCDLKKRLFKKKIFENKCYNCGLTEWLEKPISCQLEHKNGNSTDNRLENLTLLCPNCHSQTDTFAGKNKKNKNKRKKRCCKICNTEITQKSQSGLCSPCFNKTRNRSKEKSQ